MIPQAGFICWLFHLGTFGHNLLHIVHNLSVTLTVSGYSAGVGRSGTYLAIDYLLSEAAETQEIDIYERVKSLRAQRMNCVQTLVRYHQ